MSTTEDDTFDELKYTIERKGGVISYRNSKGELHRDEDKPAMIFPNGTMKWFQNGEEHRDNGQPSAIYSDGVKYYATHGIPHYPNRTYND